MKLTLSSILLFSALLFSCDTQTPEDQKERLGGYWEIESVTLADGTKRDFGMSPVIDFIEVTGDSGIRKKVAPKFDGGFTVTDSSEKFQLAIEDDSLRIYYNTAFDSWKETVVFVKDSMLKVKNQDQKEYTYRRYRKFNLSE
ncbi:lipocalin family protein [Altibacter sp.]|uniref:lipocalin family protein n=1 Tax=Altibacter sp. TaxID=2024823 RepID=UPI000C8BA30B|nr:lipocalin family protein [Altibacter sp.]MAP53386.1 hypothetical protein [Altibacter sp.]